VIKSGKITRMDTKGGSKNGNFKTFTARCVE
jgi:hypothetical protein